MDLKLDLHLNVLGIQEDDAAWCAIALEMSLMGYGETFEHALEDLYDAIVTQVTFAVQHDTLDNIFIPAEPRVLHHVCGGQTRGVERQARSSGGGVDPSAGREHPPPGTPVGNVRACHRLM